MEYRELRCCNLRRRSAWSPFLLERTVRLPICSGREYRGQCDHRDHQEGRCRPRIRLYRGRGWEGILLPSWRPPGPPRLRSPRRRRACLVRNRDQPQGPARRSGQRSLVAVRHSRPGRRQAQGPRSRNPAVQLKRSQLISRTAFVSTYSPRQCGIATFTYDLATTVGEREIVAIHPSTEPGPYPAEVRHRIRRDIQSDYAYVAQALNDCGVNVVSVQYDPSIWGGDDGVYVLDFIRALRVPMVATLHDVPAHPTPTQREIFVELVDTAAATIVMSQAAANLLTTLYDVDPDRIDIVPHGVSASAADRPRYGQAPARAAGQDGNPELRPPRPRQGFRVGHRRNAGDRRDGAYGAIHHPRRNQPRDRRQRRRGLQGHSREAGRRTRYGRTGQVRRPVRRPSGTRQRGSRPRTSSRPLHRISTGPLPEPSPMRWARARP